MSIALRVTRGYGNGTVDGTVHDIVYRGYSNGVQFGNGTVVADNSVLSGSGGPAAVTGNAVIVADNSVLSGIAVRTVIGNGTVTSDNSLLTGTAIRTIIGDAAVVADNSVLDGTGGPVVTYITGNGAVIADNSVLAGTAIRVHHGNGSITSTSTLDGIGGRVVTGDGAVYANDSVLSGASAQIIIGNGVVVADDSIVSGIEDNPYIRFKFVPFTGTHLEVDELNRLFQELFYILENELIYRDIETPFRSALDMQSYKFLNAKEGVEDDEAITLLGTAKLLGDIIVKESIHETQTEEEIVNLVSTLDETYYTPGTNELTVYVEGVKQVKDIDYSEDSSTTIVWINSPSPSNRIDFYTSGTFL